MYIVEVQGKGKGNAPGPWARSQVLAGATQWSTRDLAKNIAWMYFGRNNPAVRIRQLAETER